MRRQLAIGAAAGLLVALSLPPGGWWPLAFAGVATLTVAVADSRWQDRIWAGVGFGVVYLVIGWWWMGDFNPVGAALAVAAESLFFVAATAVTPPDRRRLVVLPAVLVLVEAFRAHIPFGGVPMAAVALGQGGGPLAAAAR